MVNGSSTCRLALSSGSSSGSLGGQAGFLCVIEVLEVLPHQPLVHKWVSKHVTPGSPSMSLLGLQAWHHWFSSSSVEDSWEVRWLLSQLLWTLLATKWLSFIIRQLVNSVRHIMSVADPGFSPGGCANSQNCYYFSIFCQKVHENERIWTPRGGGARVPGAPP